jgi:hypothetical protein
MKKILQITLIMTLAFNAQAQIPNNSLENWSSAGTFEEPDDWATSNILYYGMDLVSGGVTKTPTSALKVSPANTGSYAIQIRNVVDSVNIFGTYYPYDTIPAFALTAFAYTQRPTSMIGYYKFTQGAILPDKDSAIIAVNITKWNGSTQDTIGRGFIYVTATASAYTAFTIPINYFNATIPDSAWVYAASSINDDAYNGTSLIMDDLSFTGVTGIKNISLLGERISLYPNPALDEINFKNIPVEASNIDIRDFTGKKIQSLEVTSDLMNFKTSSLSSGMYFYSITDGSGEVLYADKFSILK